MGDEDDLEARLQATHMPSVNELVIEMLGQSEAELVEHNASLKRDIAVYATMAKEALARLNTADKQRAGLIARNQVVMGECDAAFNALSMSEAARRVLEDEIYALRQALAAALANRAQCEQGGV
jgi:hypothetical protein